MADISITVASVIKGAAAQAITGIAGTTITAGQALYIDTANSNVLKLADANGTTPANTFAGIALHASLSGQPITYNTADAAFVFGGTILAGDVVYVSQTPGGLTKTFGDLASGATVIIVGNMTSTTVMKLAPITGGVIA